MIWSTGGCWGRLRRAAERRSDLAPWSAASWVVPGRAAQTPADACRPSGAATPPGPGAAALLVGGRFRRRGLRLGVRLRFRLLVVAVVLGELGHLGRHRTWRGTSGRRDRSGPGRSGRDELPAGLRRLLLGRLHGLAAALGDGQPAREQAKTDQRSPPRPARWVAALLASLPGHHVHLPPPAPLVGLPCCFPVRDECNEPRTPWRGASQASCDRLPPADPHR